MSQEAPLAPFGSAELARQDWLSKIDLIKATVADGASDAELDLFLHVAEKRGLDPLSRQIYFVKRKGKGTIQVGIDGFRAIAHREGKCGGIDDAAFVEVDGEWCPRSATVTVWKMVGGQRFPFTATARWAEYYPGDKDGFMWKQMPFAQLAKCAEALALRKAFPEDLSGMYVPEEMDQAGKADSIDAEYKDLSHEAKKQPEPVKPPEAEKKPDEAVPPTVKAFGHSPTRFPAEKSFKATATPEQIKMAGDKMAARNIDVDMRDGIRTAVLKAYGLEDDGSKGNEILVIDWLINAPEAAIQEAANSIIGQAFLDLEEEVDDGSQKKNLDLCSYENRRVYHSWPTFEQAPDACRLTWSRVLQRPIKSMKDVGEEGWIRLAMFADEVGLNKVAEPVEFAIWKQAEGLAGAH